MKDKYTQYEAYSLFNQREMETTLYFGSTTINKRFMVVFPE